MRQHSGDNTAHFFDWLYTPARGLIGLIRDDFPILRPEDLHLVNPGTRTSAVQHVPSGIGFGHQFPRRGKVIPAEFLADYPAFASRIAYLTARFRATVREHPVQFVRRGMTRTEALELEDAMRSLYPSADMRFLYVNADQETFETPFGHSLQLAAPRTPFGDSIAWAELLQREGLIDAPFRLAPSQIVRSNTNNQLEESDGHPLGALLVGRRRNPDNPWFAHELGWKQLRRRRYRHAARLAREAVAADPRNPDFIELMLRVDLARFRSRRETALRQALTVLERTSHAGLRELSADLLIALGRPLQALDHIERGLESSPYSDEFTLRKARALFAAGRLAEALSAIDVALSLRPQGKAYVELKAKVLCALGRSGEAYALVCDTLRRKKSYRLQMLRARLLLTAGALRGRPGTARDRSLPSAATTALRGRSVDSPRSRL